MMDMNAFMLESLQEEQQQILRLMEQAGQSKAPEGALLDWALETVVTTYRELKAGRIDWWGAVKAYQAASNAALECDNVMYLRRMEGRRGKGGRG